MRQRGAAGDEVSRRWRKHLHAEFPARLRGDLFGGVDLVALEADVVGCVESWRAGGTLDADRRQVLTGRIKDLNGVLPLLTSRVEALYFERLRQVAVVVLES